MRAAAVAALLIASCGATRGPAPVSAWNGEVERWGTLREALHDGRVEARVGLAEVAREHVYAVGALEGLRGEVTVVDGEAWISLGDARRPVTTRGPAGDARATVLFAAEVRAWRDVAVEREIGPGELDAYVARRASEIGIDVLRPFPFLVEGRLVRLDAHVIAGECPIRARHLGRAMVTPAFELRRDAVEGRLVGLYAASGGGILCHGGSQTHAHVLLEADGGLTAHVESVGLATGAVLRLPVR